MIADSVGTVIRRPFAPLSRTIFNRSERLFPVIHRFFIDSVHDASARKTDKAGRKLFQVLNNVLYEYGFSIVPGIGREQGNDIYSEIALSTSVVWQTFHAGRSFPVSVHRYILSSPDFLHSLRSHCSPLSPFVNQKYT